MPEYRDWKRKLAQLAKTEVFPLTLECELTTKCNFSCPMCYAKDNRPSSEWTFLDWKQLFDEAIGIGTLFFVLTGGEPLSHPNFWQIYEYLTNKGVKITVFTNSSLIDESVINRFIKYPPELIVITLYGWDDHSVYQVTKNSDGFTKINKAIDILKQHHLPFTLRTLPIRPIYEGLDKLIAYVQSKNLFLGYQLYLSPSPKVNNIEPLRLNSTELNEFENKIRNAFSVYQQESCEISSTSSDCQAMNSGCYITHDGYMRPCVMAFDFQEKVIFNQLLQVYRNLAKRWHSFTVNSECQDCNLKRHCLSCKARLILENQNNGCSEYLKTFAAKRGVNDDGNL